MLLACFLFHLHDLFGVYQRLLKCALGTFCLRHTIKIGADGLRVNSLQCFRCLRFSWRLSRLGSSLLVWLALAAGRCVCGVLAWLLGSVLRVVGVLAGPSAGCAFGLVLSF